VTIPFEHLLEKNWDAAPCAVPEALRETHKLFLVQPPAGEKPLFTGYFEPELRGSLTKKDAYQHAIYAAPPDLWAGPNTPDTKQVGVTAWGKLVKGKLTPYVSRAEVSTGALAGKNLELVYVDDAVDLFFMHIQGSGKITLDDGTVRRVGFAGKSGHAYTPIGKILREEEGLTTVTMETIKTWLRAHTYRAPDIMNRNASFIFFKFLKGEGPVGAAGEVLKPEASLAIDDTIWPYGLDVIVETTDPLDTYQPFVRLMKTADTGSAIRGYARGDIFFGSGAEAGKKAGAMAGTGRLWIILPR
jgi:membrane-bound lytic murein transglycosylase A